MGSKILGILVPFVLTNEEDDEEKAQVLQAVGSTPPPRSSLFFNYLPRCRCCCRCLCLLLFLFSPHSNLCGLQCPCSSSKRIVLWHCCCCCCCCQCWLFVEGDLVLYCSGFALLGWRLFLLSFFLSFLPSFPGRRERHWTMAAASMLSTKMQGVSLLPIPVASSECNAEMMRVNNTLVCGAAAAVWRARNGGGLALVSSAQRLGFGFESRRRRSGYGSSCSSSSRRRENGSVVATVAVPMRSLTLPTEPEGEAGMEEEDREFDPSMPPPFTLADIRAAIPKHCWAKNPWKSMSFVARDVAIVFGLAAAAAYVNSWFVWPLYWLAQGTMFWALFVLGHDWCLPPSLPPSLSLFLLVQARFCMFWLARICVFCQFCTSYRMILLECLAVCDCCSRCVLIQILLQSLVFSGQH